MSLIYPGGDEQVTPNIGLATWGMDEVLAENMILIDAAIASGGGGTPGLPLNSVQGNKAGVFAGLPGSTIDFTNGLLSLAPTGTGVALKITSDGSSSDVLDMYIKGSAIPGAIFGNNGDGVGIYFQVTDTAGDFSAINPGSIIVEIAAGPSINLEPSTTTGGGLLVFGAGLFVDSSVFSTTSVAIYGRGDVNSSDIFQLFTHANSKAVWVDTSGNLHLNVALYDGTGSPGTSGQVLSSTVTGTQWVAASAGSGTVTSFSAGALSPLFTTSVATATTTPALSFSLNTQTENTVFAGPTSGSAATPTFRSLVAADIPSLSGIYLALAGGTMTGVLTLEASAAGLKDAAGSAGSSGQVLTINGSGYPIWTAPATSGTVTTFSAGNLSPLFTTSVATASSTPALSFSLSNAAGGTILGNNTGSTGAPAYTATPVLGINASVAGTLGLATSVGSGTTITLTNPGALTAYNFNLPLTAGATGSVLTSAGGGSAAMTWTTQAALGVAWSSLTAASANLSLANGTNTTTFNQTSNVAWLWANTTTGTSGTTNASPLLELSAQYYTGATTGTDLWTIGSSLASGTNGASNLNLTHTGSTGTQTVAIVGSAARLYVGSATEQSATGVMVAGTFYSTNGTNYLFGIQQSNANFVIANNAYLAWSSSTSALGSLDTSISRSAAGVVAIGTGGQGSTAGTLALSRLNGYSADMSGTVSSAPTGITATNVVVAVGGATGTFTVGSTEGFTVGDTVNLSASGWSAGSGLASTVATVASVTSTTVLVLTYVSGGPWVAGTYTTQTGTLTQTGGTSVSVKYATAYTSTPIVVVTPTSNAGAFYLSASSTTGFTITYGTSGTQTFNYHVIGNPS